MQKVLDEQLAVLKQHLETQISLEKQRLGRQLQQIAESNIAEIKNRAEESVRKAVGRYEIAIAKADATAKDPAMSFLAEQMRKSAKREMDITIQAHTTLADNSIRSIRNLVK